MRPSWRRPSAGLVGGLVAASVAATTLQGAIESAIPSREAVPGPPLTTGQGATGTAAPSSRPTAMMTASPAPDAWRHGSNGLDLRPTSDPAPQRPPVDSAGRFADLLRRLRTSVAQGLSAGEIRGDVGRDLENVISDVRREVDPDDPGEVRDGVARLKEKVATRTREGAITRHRADELFLILDGAS
jgi:serine/threonine-protein kinase